MSGVSDLVVEIGTEELPYAAQAPLALALANGLEKALGERGLTPADVTPYWGPRRLAVVAAAVPGVEPDRPVERRGPSFKVAFDGEGRPTKAAEGFARSAGVAVDALETLEVPEGKWLVHRYTEKGRPAAEVLADMLPGLATSLPLPRRMRWGSGDAVFLRPVRWLLARLGRDVIPFEAFGLTAGGDSFGHRVHHPGAVAVRKPAEYAERLAAARVMADPEARFIAVRDMVDGAARGIDGVPAPTSTELYTEIAGMVEWPVAVTGGFERRFLELGEAVVVTTLAHHQRLVPVRGADGALTNHFVAVVNLASRDPEAVRHGLERVVRPRLEDAEFYFHRDLKRPLGDHGEELEGLGFAPRLGTMAEKGRRVAPLAARTAEALGQDRETVAAARRAGELAKCDLVTGMVFEFPELQGVMGGIYARRGGEPDAVADAIAEQYRPAGSDDALPQTAAGTALAIADRLDTLVGCFAAGLEPTGAKDPFGLRRAAFGVLRIAAETPAGLDLGPLMQAAADGYRDGPDAVRTLPALTDFLRERLRSLLLDGGRSADVVQAVLAVAPLAPREVLARAEALSGFRKRPEAGALAAANKRIANILRQAGETADSVQPAGAAEGAEATLEKALATARTRMDTLAADDFGGALEVLAELRDPVDRFFDEVLVMDPDPAVKARRLTLLASLRKAFLEIADVGELQGTGAES